MTSKIVVVSGKSKHTIYARKGQVVTIWKLGDKTRGWIPSKKHFNVFRKLLDAALKDPKGGHIIFHYGVEVKQVRV